MRAFILTVVLAASVALGGFASTSTAAPTCAGATPALNHLLAVNEHALDSAELIDIDEYGLALRSINRAITKLHAKSWPCNRNLRRAFSYQDTALKYQRKAVLAYRAGSQTQGNRFIRLSGFYTEKVGDALGDYRDE